MPRWTGFVYSPDGQHIAVCAIDNTVKILDVETGAISLTLHAPENSKIVYGTLIATAISL